MLKNLISILPFLALAAGLSTSACATPSGDAVSVPRPSHSPYPEIWFAPVNDPNPPAWEILPQAAGPGEVILSKRNELGILSNFAPTPFKFRGRTYGSLEGFWQMMHFPESKVDGKPDPRRKLSRTEWKYERDAVAAMTAFEAKAAGDHGEKLEAKLGIDWVSFEGHSLIYRSAKRGEHYRLIRSAMIAKLKQNPEVRRILLATGDLVLRPDHHGEANAPDEWLYYQVWMELRAELFAGLPLE
ncbi:MAG: NADAR family protein [Bdellovibrionales bacterium]|nr:NADAR family protein [Bdellovibrionales bacterium]